MATQDEIMAHIIELVREGAGGTLTPAVEAALRHRYRPWIVKKKDKVPTTPQEIWNEKEGSAIQDRLRYLGQELKKGHEKLLLSQEECDAICLTVETASDCPHCPDPPTI
ncbi:MAG: hypothetical protein ACJ76N_17170 [Thermoanaerobaculia bacterium]